MSTEIFPGVYNWRFVPPVRESQRVSPLPLHPHPSIMPKTMPTPGIDALRRFTTERHPLRPKLFSWNNISKSISIVMFRSKLLILFVILVRDQEVGGSNPLAPTKSFNHFKPFLETREFLA